jgi:hypothetical protein
VAEREALHFYLSPEAKRKIDEFTAEQGISMSGFVEAMASDGDLLNGSLDALMERIVRDARKIDVARRRRGGRPAKR